MSNSMLSNGPFGDTGRVNEEEEALIESDVSFQFAMAIGEDQVDTFNKVLKSPAFMKTMEKEALNMINRAMRSSVKGGKQWFDDVVIEKMNIK